MPKLKMLAAKRTTKILVNIIDLAITVSTDSKRRKLTFCVFFLSYLPFVRVSQG